MTGLFLLLLLLLLPPPILADGDEQRDYRIIEEDQEQQMEANLVEGKQLEKEILSKLISDPPLSHEEILAILVHDFILLRSKGEKSAKKETWVIFDSRDFERREREVKDRYETLFVMIWRQLRNKNIKVEYPSEDWEEELVLSSAWIPELQQSHEKYYIGTRSNWKDVIRAASKTPLGKMFVSTMDDIKNYHQEIMEIYTPLTKDYLIFEINFPIKDFRKNLPQRNSENEKYFNLFNVTYLPTLAELYEIFPWLHPTAKEPIVTDPFFEQNVASDPKISFITPIDWVYFYSNRFNKVCEVFTQDYINGLAKYLAERIKQLLQTLDSENPVINIVEIGAGNGRLSHFLNIALRGFEEISGKYMLVATDIGGSQGDFTESLPVEQLSHKKALTKYSPQIVLCSWMTMGLDLSERFRKTKSVEEYILIGEVDFGVSGRARETWGIVGNTLYSEQGFRRISLKNLSLLQVARSDSPLVKFHSQTTVFRRHEHRGLVREEL